MILKCNIYIALIVFIIENKTLWHNIFKYHHKAFAEFTPSQLVLYISYVSFFPILYGVDLLPSSNALGVLNDLAVLSGSRLPLTFRN